MLIRPATPDDAQAVLAIYAPLVRDTAISFELEPPDLAEMRARIAKTLPVLPWLVSEDALGDVNGYVYASKHRERAAYQWSVDASVYVDPAHHRRGIAGALYGRLFTLLRLQGFHAVHAGITLPNPGSVGLHESLGFRQVGVYRGVGYKMGAWRDVGWWQLRLATGPH